MGTFHSCCVRPKPTFLTQNTTRESNRNIGCYNTDTLDFCKLAQENDNNLAVRHKTSSHKRVSLDDFTILKLLGKGSFGKVVLVQKVDTGKVYAMKVLKKDALIKKSQKLHTKAEREILENMESPFILQLHFAFQTNDKLYMVTDFMNGGELFFHLRKEKKFLESKARFYAAEIILALEYLHSRGIVYRDLKPENILINGDGHVKIADFNLSKQGVEDGSKTYTFCGTPEYLAPEILQGKGHDKTVDYWSLGVLIYEMLSGGAPFYSRDKHQMFKNILEKSLEMKPYFSAEACSLLSALLVVDPTKRLSNIHDLKRHEFFRGLDWKKLEKFEVKAPFIPKVTDERDIRYFDKTVTEGSPETPTSHNNDHLDSTCQGLTFKGFTYDAERICEESTEDLNFAQTEERIKEWKITA